MAKAKGPAKPPAKATKKASPKQPSARSMELDPALIAELSRLLTLEDSDDDDDAPEDRFLDFLDLLEDDEAGDEEKQNSYVDFVHFLDGLRIDADGGDARAKEALKTIRDVARKEIDDETIGPAELMLTAKAFAEAGLDVPDSIKSALAEALESEDSFPQDEVESAGDLVDSFVELAEMVDGDPFALFEQLRTLTAGLPNEHVGGMLEHMAASGHGLALHAIAGFALHKDADLAAAAAGVLEQAASRGPVESRLVERLARIRPWLPAARQPPLDRAIAALRRTAEAPSPAPQGKPTRIVMTVCDGSGGQSAIATLKVGRKYMLVALLLSPRGVKDAWLRRDFTKAMAHEAITTMAASAPSFDVTLEAVERRLALAIGENIAAGAPPRFQLVEILEALGIGPIGPDMRTPDELAADLLAPLAPELVDEKAARGAQVRLAAGDFAENWFDIDDAADALLRKQRNARDRAKTLLKSFYPERRRYWARNAALSALAARGPDGNAPEPLAIELALAARDFASDKDPASLPLLAAIAESTVRSFKLRR